MTSSDLKNLNNLSNYGQFHVLSNNFKDKVKLCEVFGWDITPLGARITELMFAFFLLIHILSWNRFLIT